MEIAPEMSSVLLGGNFEQTPSGDRLEVGRRTLHDHFCGIETTSDEVEDRVIEEMVKEADRRGYLDLKRMLLHLLQS